MRSEKTTSTKRETRISVRRSDELFELLELADGIRHAADLFKEIVKGHTDRCLASVHPEVRKRERMIAALLQNEYNSQPTPYENRRATPEWFKCRYAEYEKVAAENG